MKRLHELNGEQLKHWVKARKEAGREEYGDAHLKRYNLVDVVEELIDAYIILELFEDRMEKEDINYPVPDKNFIKHRIYKLINYLQELDEKVPDKACTDNTNRIWWWDDEQKDT